MKLGKNDTTLLGEGKYFIIFYFLYFIDHCEAMNGTWVIDYYSCLDIPLLYIYFFNFFVRFVMFLDHYNREFDVMYVCKSNILQNMYCIFQCYVKELIEQFCLYYIYMYINIQG